jgi:hypothetical protein
VPIVHCVPAWARVRPWLSAVAAGALLLVALVGPATAHQPSSNELTASDRPARLREAGVAPRLARTSTTIHFSVTFRDPAGAAPTWVQVLIDGHPRSMTATGAAKDYRLGVRFAVATTLNAGRHRIRFRARTADGVVISAGGGAVRITRPSSGGGESGPASAGSAGDRVSSSGDSTLSSGDPTSGGEPAASAGTDGQVASGPVEAGPAGGMSPGAAAEQTGDTTGPVGSTPDASDDRPDASGPPLPDGVVDGADTVSGEPAAAGPPTASSDPAAPIGSVAADPGGPGGPGGGAGGDAAPRGLELLGGGRSLFDQVFRAYPVMITTTGSAVVWAGFVIFGRRRRDGDPSAPDPVLASNAATGPEPVPFTELVPPETPPWPVPPGVDPDEASLPRWRRPSLLQARKTDPLRTASTAVSLTFADGAVEPFDGMERRRIRYRLVRLLDVPDELRANEIGILDEGDEVQLLESRGTYRLVLCPDGRQGWLHKMVLGDLVAAGERSAEPAPDGIDGDVLAAFIATRQKSA